MTSTESHPDAEPAGHDSGPPDSPEERPGTGVVRPGTGVVRPGTGVVRPGASAAASAAVPEIEPDLGPIHVVLPKIELKPAKQNLLDKLVAPKSKKKKNKNKSDSTGEMPVVRGDDPPADATNTFPVVPAAPPPVAPPAAPPAAARPAPPMPPAAPPPPMPAPPPPTQAPPPPPAAVRPTAPLPAAATRPTPPPAAATRPTPPPAEPPTVPSALDVRRPGASAPPPASAPAAQQLRPELDVRRPGDPAVDVPRPELDVRRPGASGGPAGDAVRPELDVRRPGGSGGPADDIVRPAAAAKAAAAPVRPAPQPPPAAEPIVPVAPPRPEPTAAPAAPPRHDPPTIPVASPRVDPPTVQVPPRVDPPTVQVPPRVDPPTVQVPPPAARTPIAPPPVQQAPVQQPPQASPPPAAAAGPSAPPAPDVRRPGRPTPPPPATFGADQAAPPRTPGVPKAPPPAQFPVAEPPAARPGRDTPSEPDQRRDPRFGPQAGEESGWRDDYRADQRRDASTDYRPDTRRDASPDHRADQRRDASTDHRADAPVRGDQGRRGAGAAPPAHPGTAPHGQPGGPHHGPASEPPPGRPGRGTAQAPPRRTSGRPPVDRPAARTPEAPWADERAPADRNRPAEYGPAAKRERSDPQGWDQRDRARGWDDADWQRDAERDRGDAREVGVLADDALGERKPRRGRLIAAAAIVAAVGLTAGGVASANFTGQATWLGSPLPASAGGPVLGALVEDAPAPDPAKLAARVDGLLADSRLGKHVTASVVDVSTGDSLYEREASAATVPASTTKIVTAAAVLAARGPHYRIETTVVEGSTPGEVVIVGGGDPALAVNENMQYPGAGRLDKLAKQVVKALGDQAPTRVVVDNSAYSGSTAGPGWYSSDLKAGYIANITALMTDGARRDATSTAPNAARYDRPDLAAGQLFAKELGLPASAVTIRNGAAVDGARELGKVSSPTIATLVERMLLTSDNIVAEMLARQVALAKGMPGSFAGAAEATREVLVELGLPTDGYGLVDGSGMSHGNKLSASLLTAIVARAASDDAPQLRPLITGLPVAAYSGTLYDRYRSSSAGAKAAGTVRAKTGTLSGVTALAGLAVDADGRLLAFALMADQTDKTSDRGKYALDSAAAAIVTCGCP
ncbi:D-alanyl-D-alanine carboxypeptidase/D-alanyl-D-alanine endopeptidase [Luedemannella helvata]|uniref:Serine-type D-Ala-D-Ala carboxypeptidase n=1 Tax=Luedemannella helvata TaxID=349315 RepID=A0ABP4WN38_9ACTN